MRLDLMEILVCAVCRGDLDLKISNQEGDEIVEGTLTCKECGEICFPDRRHALPDTQHAAPGALRRRT